MFALILFPLSQMSVEIPSTEIHWLIDSNQIQRDLTALNSVSSDPNILFEHIGGAGNLNTYRLSGMSLLEKAVQWKLPKAAGVLIQAGFDLKARATDQSSILSFIIKQTMNLELTVIEKREWVPVAKSAIERGADASSNMLGDCPLIEAVNCAQSWFCGGIGDYTLLSLILSKGGNPNMVAYFKGPTGDSLEVTTPLLQAVRVNDPDLALFLLKHGANKDLRCAGISPLAYAESMSTINVSAPGEPPAYPWRKIYEILANYK